MKTTTAQFHPMRGHVEDGYIIVAPNGNDYTLKNTMRGWVVVNNKDGLPVSGNLQSAHDVSFFVVNGLGY